MCDNNCIEFKEREKVFNILKELSCLKSIIDDIEKTYMKKAYIGNITTLISDSNEFIYYGGPKKYKVVNTSRIDILDNKDNLQTEETYSAHYNYWLKCKQENEKMPESIKAHCLCFHCIKNLCFIKHIKTGKIYTIGIECINKFTNNRRTCDICNNPHRNSKDNHCKDCRIKIKDELKLKEEKEKIEIENQRRRDLEIYYQKKRDKEQEYYFREGNICKFGKYKGEEFNIVFKDKSYIKWALKNFDIDNKNNLYYLLKLYKEWRTN